MVASGGLLLAPGPGEFWAPSWVGNSPHIKPRHTDWQVNRSKEIPRNEKRLCKETYHLAGARRSGVSSQVWVCGPEWAQDRLQVPGSTLRQKFVLLDYGGHCQLAVVSDFVDSHDAALALHADAFGERDFGGQRQGKSDL